MFKVVPYKPNSDSEVSWGIFYNDQILAFGFSSEEEADGVAISILKSLKEV